MKNITKIAIIIILAILVVFSVRFFIGGPEDSWICVNNSWIKHGLPNEPMPTKACGQTLPVEEKIIPEVTTKIDESEIAKNTLTTFFEYLSKNEFEKAISLTDTNDSAFWDTVKIYSQDNDDKTKMLETYCTATQTCLKAKVLEVKQVTKYEYSLIVQFINKDGSIYKVGPCCGEEPNGQPLKEQFDYTVKKINDDFKVTTPPMYRP
jgi:hypothetical protein